MQAQPFKSRGLVDYLFDFSKGVNNGIDHILLPKDQLHSGQNTTVRGSFVGPRPVFRKIPLTGEFYGGGADLSSMLNGRYQGRMYEPEVKTFMDDLVEEKRKVILRLIQKLNEIHVRSQTIDGITSSFNKIDG